MGVRLSESEFVATFSLHAMTAFVHIPLTLPTCTNLKLLTSFEILGNSNFKDDSQFLCEGFVTHRS